MSNTNVNQLSAMDTNDLDSFELLSDELDQVSGGWRPPGWLKTAGEIVAPLLGAAGAPLANKKAMGHGAIWAGGGALAGAAGGPAGAALGGAGGFLAGYYDSLFSQHGG